jgi:probable F420-dependent oxidoreductase
MTERLGLTVGLDAGPLRDQVALCERAVELGYTDVWSAEVGGTDAFTPLAALARAGVGARLGTAIVPVFTRPPALLAMSAAALQDLTQGKFVLGLGTSSDVIVNNWMGGSFVKPLARLKETVEVLRDAFAGNKVSFEGTSFSIRDFRLQLDTSTPPPIYLAALGPKACRLAGEVADGVIFFLKTPDGVREALTWVADGARAAGRDAAQLDCVIRLTVAVDENPDALAVMERRLITAYAMVDVYNRSLAQQGFASKAKEIVDAWRSGDRGRAAASVTDSMRAELNVTGDVQTCARRLRAFRDAGVKTPVLLPVSAAADGDQRAERIANTVRALAPS